MNDAILIELASKWDRNAKAPEVQNGAEEFKLANAREQGARECKKACADTLRMLVSIIGA